MRLPVMTSPSSPLAAAALVWVVSQPAASTEAANTDKSNTFFICLPSRMWNETTMRGVRRADSSAAAHHRGAGLLVAAFLVAAPADGLHRLGALAAFAGEPA